MWWCDMAGYILSILGIVIAGIFIDIIIPNGAINKYIKGVYSIFVVAVLINPVVKFLNKEHNFTIKYEEYNISANLLSHIYEMRSKTTEQNIETHLKNEGLENIDIILSFSIENEKLKYNSCIINLKNMTISQDKQHINKYEFIKDIVKQHTNLTDEEIIIDE
jgi:stage III sporulation protein AF